MRQINFKIFAVAFVIALFVIFIPSKDARAATPSCGTFPNCSAGCDPDYIEQTCTGTPTTTPKPTPTRSPVICGDPPCLPGCTLSGNKCVITDGAPPPPPPPVGGGGGGTNTTCGTLGLVERNGLCFPEEVVKGEEGSLVSSTTVGGLIKNVVNILLVLVGALSVLFLVIGAVLYMTSAGNTGQAGKGKQTMMTAIFGLMITALAYTIVTISYNLLTKGSVF